MIHRIGTFFMLLGGLLVALFVLSDMAGSPTCGFILFGGAFLALGIFLWFRDPTPPGPPPERFRLLKGMSKRQERDKKQ